MEDYRKAYKERLADKQKLEEADRRVAAMHIGGIVIECHLKAMRVKANSVTDWHIPEEKCSSCKATVHPGFPQKHGIVNPGHRLFFAIQSWPKLWQQLSQMKQERDKIIGWINLLEKPSCNYIDLRYTHETPTDQEFQAWHEAFKRVEAWLRVQDKP
jgi:hypothetical protein